MAPCTKNVFNRSEKSESVCVNLRKNGIQITKSYDDKNNMYINNNSVKKMDIGKFIWIVPPGDRKFLKYPLQYPFKYPFRFYCKKVGLIVILGFHLF